MIVDCSIAQTADQPDHGYRDIERLLHFSKPSIFAIKTIDNFL